MASIAGIGIPSGGLVNIYLILKGIGIDQNQLGLIFVADWLVYIDKFIYLIFIYNILLKRFLYFF